MFTPTTLYHIFITPINNHSARIHRAQVIQSITRVSEADHKPQQTPIHRQSDHKCKSSISNSRFGVSNHASKFWKQLIHNLPTLYLVSEAIPPSHSPSNHQPNHTYAETTKTEHREELARLIRSSS